MTRSKDIHLEQTQMEMYIKDKLAKVDLIRESEYTKLKDLALQYGCSQSSIQKALNLQRGYVHGFMGDFVYIDEIESDLGRHSEWISSPQRIISKKNQIYLQTKRL